MATKGDHELGVVRYGPVEIRHKIETTDTLLKSINQEVSASKADDVFKAKWGDLYRDWLEFYGGKLEATGLVSHLRDSTFDRAAAYRREALKFHYALLKAMPPAARNAKKADGGVHLPKLPDVHLPKLPDISLPRFPSLPWGTIAYAGAWVLGGVVLFRIVRSQR